MTAYRQLEERFRRIATLEQAISVLHWDTASMMPSGGAAARTEQLATLRMTAHQHLIAPEVEAECPDAGAEPRPGSTIHLGQKAAFPGGLLDHTAQTGSDERQGPTVNDVAAGDGRRAQRVLKVD